MIIHDVEQRTEEWHKIKRGKVGGTLAKGLFVKSDTLLNELVSQLIEYLSDEEYFISFDMQRGVDLEPEAIAELSREVFCDFLPVGFLQHDEIPILGISPDGISSCKTIQCEIKCPGAKKHTDTIINNCIPKDNIHQVIHAFVVNDNLESLYFCSYRPESNVCPLWYKEIKRESIINLGTKSKPNMKTISEWVNIAIENAKELNEKLNDTLIKLKDRYETNK